MGWMIIEIMLLATEPMLSEAERDLKKHQLPWRDEKDWTEVGLAKQNFLQKPQFEHVPNWVTTYLQQLIDIVKPYSAICEACKKNSGDSARCSWKCSSGDCRRKCFGERPEYDRFKDVLRKLQREASVPSASVAMSNVIESAW